MDISMGKPTVSSESDSSSYGDETIQRIITRTKVVNDLGARRFCSLRISLVKGRLSVTTEEGAILSRKDAKQLALDYWTSYFDEDVANILEMNQRLGTHFQKPLSAAKHVVKTDGEFHGLDVFQDLGKDIYLTESCGPASPYILEWFPEVKPLLPWHLNDMHAGCEHQDALGWGPGFTVALTKHTLTDAQRAVFDEKFDAETKAKQEKEFNRRWREIRASESAAKAWLKKHRGIVTVHDVEVLLRTYPSHNVHTSKALRAYDRWLNEEVAKDMPVPTFDHEIYKDSLGAPCPTCGYRYGTAWLTRELPPDIVILAKTIGSQEGV